LVRFPLSAHITEDRPRHAIIRLVIIVLILAIDCGRCSYRAFAT